MLALDELEREGYHTVAVAAPDHQGRPVGRLVPVRSFLSDPERGVDVSSYALVYDVAGIPLADSPFAGAHTGYHDVRLRPDLTTLRPYPGVEHTAVCIADAVDSSGREVTFAPRTILKRQIDVARNRGYDVRLATELEFYLFHDNIRHARRLGYRGLEPTTPARSTYGIAAAVAEPFLQTVSDAMQAAGFAVGSAQTEAGRGQWEVNLDHADVLLAADQHFLFKLCVKEVARQADVSATFMARPVPDDLGSSCHIHCSLFDGARPVFPDTSESGELSPLARHFLGGLLTRLAETAVLFAPYANSYKRHAPGFAAGGVIAWGEDNRSVAIRVAGHGATLRLEHRFPGADANPYLAAAAVVAAGLDGIACQRDPGPATEGDADARSDLRRTPASLGEALAALERSHFVKESFGADVAEHMAAHARAEWAAFLAAVTDWEITRGFEAV